MSNRRDKIEDLLRAELSAVLLREIADPRLRLASVQRVVVRPDLSLARVGLSILGTDEEREAALEAARNASSFIRRCLGRGLRLRRIPELDFHLDQGSEHSQHISDLLEDLSP